MLDNFNLLNNKLGGGGASAKTAEQFEGENMKNNFLLLFALLSKVHLLNL